MTLLKIQKRINELLEKGKPGDLPSQATDFFLSFLIILNLLAVCLETVDSLNKSYSNVFWYVEAISVAIFSLEYCLRIWSVAAPARIEGKSIIKARFGYIFSFTGLVDLIAILPSLLPLLTGGIDLRWLRVLRLARLFKFSHYNSALEDLISAIKHESRSFLATLYLLFLAIMISSTLIYVLEQQHQPETFGSIPESMWWALITLTTVGYGDVVPTTVAGKAVAVGTALMGVCVVALLTGIVATGFANQMAMKRSRLETEIQTALSDGIISDDEKKKIDALRDQLNLTEEDALVLLEQLESKRK